EGLACILVEPVAGNMGVVPPEEGLLDALRDLCDASGALLGFDGVFTGFPFARGGAQDRFAVTPALTIPVNVVGGVLPSVALGGRIYVAPSQCEAMFVSLAHSDEDVDRTVEAVAELAGG